MRLTDDVAFPYLLLLVSGGHCQLLVVEGVGRYRRLGTTMDDAVGEAFDKTAKLLGLGYPGGPALEAAATGGDTRRFALPRPMLGRPGCDFSFSGLKTALRHAIEKLPPGPIGARDMADLAASFQAAIADVLADRTGNAIAVYRRECGAGGTLVVAGGVAANAAIRARLKDLAEKTGLRFTAPPPRAVHRQRRDDRLGRAGAAQTRPDRRPRLCAQAALAARPERGVAAASPR